MTEFGRCYRITVIGVPELIDVRGLDRSFFEETRTITEITELDIKLEVEKHLREHPNQAKLTIYNLANRDEFVLGGPQKIRVEAGYDSTPRALFVGDVRFASHDHEGVDWLTKIQIADGGRAYAEARSPNRSYASGTPYATIIGDVVKQFGVRLPEEIAGDERLRARIATGEVLSGYAADELTRLLARFNLRWSFQGERLQVLRDDQVVPSSPRIISEDSGMIGSPTVDPPRIVAPPKHRSKKPPKVPKLKVKHLLYPELTPGEQIEIRSRSINGRFRIDTVKHSLDSRGDDWDTEIEASSV